MMVGTLRTTIALLDQAVWSVGNFVLGISIAATAGPATYAEFVVIQAIYVLGLALVRAIGPDAAMIDAAQTDSGAGRLAVTGAGVGALLTAVVVTAAWFVGIFDELGGAAVGATFAALAQEGSRQSLLIRGAVPRMLGSDLLWTVAVAGGALAAFVRDVSASTIMWSWALGAAASFALNLTWGARPASLPEYGQWAARGSHRLFGLLVDNTVGRAAPAAALIIGALLLSTDDLATVGLARIFIAPGQVVLAALVGVITAELVRRTDDRTTASGRLPVLFAVPAILISMLAIALSSVLASVLSDYERTSVTAHTVLWALVLVTAAFVHAERVRSRTADRVETTRVASIQSGVAIIVGATSGAAAFGSMGLVAGIAAGTLASALIWRRTTAALGASPGLVASPAGKGTP